MLRNIRFYLFTLALLAVVGCIQKKDKLTLNPDGSGKLVMEMTMTPMGGMGMGGENGPKPEDMAKSAIAGILRKSEGVDAWRDVGYEATAEGSIRVYGTAYFKHIERLKIENSDGMLFSWKEQGDDVRLLTIEPKDQEAAEEGEAPPEMTDEQVKAKVAEVKMQYNMQKPMMQPVFSTMKMDTVVMLPGKTSHVSVFDEVEGGVQLVIDGEKMMAAVDKMMNDDALIEKSIRSGKQPGPGDAEEFTEILFGKKGKISATVTDLKPQFDYDTEMKAARAAQPAMMQQLGL